MRRQEGRGYASGLMKDPRQGSRRRPQDFCNACNVAVICPTCQFFGGDAAAQERQRLAALTPKATASYFTRRP